MAGDIEDARIAALPRLKVILTLGDVARRNVLRALGLKASAGPYAVLSSHHCSRLNTNTGAHVLLSKDFQTWRRF